MPLAGDTWASSKTFKICRTLILVEPSRGRFVFEESFDDIYILPMFDLVIMLISSISNAMLNWCANGKFWHLNEKKWSLMKCHLWCQICHTINFVVNLPQGIANAKFNFYLLVRVFTFQYNHYNVFIFKLFKC